jgi:hypothetical protein
MNVCSWRRLWLHVFHSAAALPQERENANGRSLAETLFPFRDKQDIAHLEGPDGGHKGPCGFEAFEDGLRVAVSSSSKHLAMTTLYVPAVTIFKAHFSGF